MKTNWVINNVSEEIFKAANNELKAYGAKSQKRLRYCCADVFQTENYFILKSYATFVAAIDKTTLQGVDVLRLVYGYTATSAQHIRKFFEDYGAEVILTYRP